MPTAHLDLPFHPDDPSLLLDLHLPDGPPAPVVVWIHGGGWRSGSRQGGPALRLVERGYTVASLSYTFSHQALFPRQVLDVLQALRWLVGSASTYGYLADKFVLWGHSAGGHLAAWLGCLRGSPIVGQWTPELEACRGFESVVKRVVGVVDFCGPTDFLAMDDFPGALRHEAPDSPESQLVGGPIQEQTARVQLANPLTFVNPGSSPFLICHGDADLFVPIDQSRRLYLALRQLGVQAELVEIPAAGHVFRTGEIMNKIEGFVRDYSGDR